MASGGRLYLWVTFRPSWGGVPCRIALKVNGFQGKIRLLPQFFTRIGVLLCLPLVRTGCPIPIPQPARAKTQSSAAPVFARRGERRDSPSPRSRGECSLTNVRGAERRKARVTFKRLAAHAQ